MIDAAFTGLEPVTSAKTACRLLGKARATLYRQRNPAPSAGRPAARRAAHPAALSAAERAVLLAVLDGDRFVGKSPAQAWAILLDEGTYLASISTMYRVHAGHRLWPHIQSWVAELGLTAPDATARASEPFEKISSEEPASGPADPEAARP